MLNGDVLQKWNKRWLILRRAAPRSGGSVRLEKYENEAAAANQASSHCAVYDLGHKQSICRMMEGSKPGICITFDDYSTVQFTTESSKLDQLQVDSVYFRSP